MGLFLEGLQCLVLLSRAYWSSQSKGSPDILEVIRSSVGSSQALIRAESPGGLIKCNARPLPPETLIQWV